MKHYFEGWYYKQQANGRTLAVIPGKSDTGAFIQVITDKESFCIPFQTAMYKNEDFIQIGNNRFSSSGIEIDIKRPDFSLCGTLHYTNLSPLKGDIMGPFRFFPMECRHGIVSMRHGVSGEIILNGENLNFHDGIGYIETDSGCSFPERYAWIHCNDFKENGSVMASVASIPFAGFRFWGLIGIVWINGREYRLATYKGAQILRCGPGIFEIRQGNYLLTITVSRGISGNLAAPKSGAMNRVIKESASCPARFVFTWKRKIIFSAESRCASYEYAF